MQMDQIVLPFRFVADDEEMPDLSDYQDPIVIRVILEPTDPKERPDA